MEALRRFEDIRDTIEKATSTIDSTVLIRQDDEKTLKIRIEVPSKNQTLVFWADAGSLQEIRDYLLNHGFKEKTEFYQQLRKIGHEEKWKKRSLPDNPNAQKEMIKCQLTLCSSIKTKSKRM